MHKYYLTKLRFIPALMAVFLLTNCTSQEINTKSSVMEYLYPNSRDTMVEPGIPHLRLPLRVGIAFVPESTETSGLRKLWTDRAYSGMSSEAKKNDLLEKVAEEFRDMEFVKSIEVIPTAYLRRKGSFTNLSQIRSMYGIDVIALVSYDQVQFTDEGALSLSYWTIVGAYVVSGQKNDTNTLMDTVVYDIESKKMLFRAPGTSYVAGNSTPVNSSEELRLDSLQSFEEAAKEMTVNLQEQLSKFKISIKNKPSKAKVSYRKGYSISGGGFGLFEIAMMLSLGLVHLRRKS